MKKTKGFGLQLFDPFSGYTEKDLEQKILEIACDIADKKMRLATIESIKADLEKRLYEIRKEKGTSHGQ